MSYILEKYKDGEVKMRGLAMGWYFPETNEFRPLTSEAMMELFLAGYADLDIMYETAVKRNEELEKFLANYTPRELNDEDIYEMKAAFGEDEDIVDVFSGDIIHLADY